MENRKAKNPLRKRVFRELRGDWKKYLVVSLFLVLTIGFVSGMYVANGSMMAAADAGMIKYKLENGHFELNRKAGKELLAAIQSGKKADIRQYYMNQAKEELDENFEDKFAKKFRKKFDLEFQAEFDLAFERQVKQSLLAQGLGKASAEEILSAALEQAKQEKSYKSSYLAAYKKAYRKSYAKAYVKAYKKAWKDVQNEVEKEYADAKERYGFDDPEFQDVPVELYENFFRNEEEDNNNDGKADGTVRVYAKTQDINLACQMQGRLPKTEGEIALDRMHADNAGIKIGDIVTVGGCQYETVGLIAYVNYSTLHEKSTDLIFDALKFDVAMVTDEGFLRLDSAVHYTYAWQYANQPVDVKEEKRFSDHFQKALLTQAVVADCGLEDYMPAYTNPAIHFATDDMGSDKAMGGVLLDILIVIIAFIFAVTISNTIAKEASAIGTLRALGYRKTELTRHYLAMPVIVTLVAAAVGNVLGYTVFKNVVVSMYYNSYSLPAYDTVWNPEAFFKTTLIPVALMLAVNLIVIIKVMQHTPLQFLRHDLKKKKRKKAVRLPGWNFLARFRMRIILQNVSNYAILFVGILFIATMLSMAVGMPDTLDYYKKNARHMMLAKYQYVLKSDQDEGGDVVRTKNTDAEKFAMKSLQKKGEALNEEVSVYGIMDGSRYVKIDGLAALQENEAYISFPFAEKYGLSIGDSFILDEKYEECHYQFKVAGIYDKCQSIAVFLPIQNYRSVFDLEKGEFSGYFSKNEITDISTDNIATVITEREIIKMCDQLEHSMGSYMEYFQILCTLLSAVLIYLLTKIIIEKNATAISMTKILGYEDSEIAGLYLLSTTIVVVIADAVCAVTGALIMRVAWQAIMSSYCGWFSFIITTAGYMKIFVFILIGYLLVMVLDFYRIKKVPMDEVLKNME